MRLTVSSSSLNFVILSYDLSLVSMFRNAMQALFDVVLMNTFLCPSYSSERLSFSVVKINKDFFMTCIYIT